MTVTVRHGSAERQYLAPQPVVTDRVVFLTGESPDDLLTYLCRDWAGALAAAGQPAHVLDLSHDAGIAALQQMIASERPKAFVAFTGVGADLRSNGRSLYEVIGVPYVGIMLDPPAYFPERHRSANPYQLFLFTDVDNLGPSRELSPPNALRGYLRYGCAAPTAPALPLASRDIPLLFAKRGGDPEIVRTQWAGLPAAMQSIYEDVLASTLWSTEHAIWDVAKDRLAASGLVSGFEHQAGFSRLVMLIDAYIRRARATRLTRALLPFDAVIVGNDWSHVDSTGAKARFLPATSLPALFGLFDRSQVAVNVQPANRYAPHERLLFGMQRECVVLSDANPVLRSTMGSSRFLHFEWDETLEDRIADSLRDVGSRQPMVAEAGSYARDDWGLGRVARDLSVAIDSYVGLLAM
jgi:hypothetical protein